MPDDRQEAVEAPLLGGNCLRDGPRTLLKPGVDADLVAATVNEAMEVTGAFAILPEDHPTHRTERGKT